MDERTYEAPALDELGSVTELTLAGGAGSADGQKGSATAGDSVSNP